MLYSSILLDSLLTVAEAQTRLQLLTDDSMVVVRRQLCAEVLWYILSSAQIQSLLDSTDSSIYIEVLLGLHEYMSVEAIQTNGLPPIETTAHDKAIILEKNRIVGIVMDGDTIPAELSPSFSREAPPIPLRYGLTRSIGVEEKKEEEEETGRGITTGSGGKLAFKAEPLVQGPDEVVMYEEFQLIVGLRKPEVGTVQPGIVIEIPEKLKKFSLDINISGSGFDAPDGFAYQLPVETDDPEHHSIEVTLIPTTPSNSAKHRAALLGGHAFWQAQINVVYLYKGNPVGFAAHRLLVRIGDGEVERQGTDLPTNWLADVPEPCAAPVVAGIPQPDLTIIITKPNGDPTDGLFQASIRSPHLPMPPSLSFDIDLGLDPSGFAESLMQEIPLQDGHALIKSTIEGIGSRVAGVVKDPKFWGLVQNVLTTAYVERGNPPTVLLLTAEPHVPWELADIGSTILPGTTHSLLAVQARVGRWILGDGNCTPMQSDLKLNVDGMAVCVGEYTPESGLSRLPCAEDEGDFLMRNFNSTFFVEANSYDVNRLLTGKLPDPVQLMHFACHGDSCGALNYLYMNDGHQMPDLVIEHSVAGKRDHPFVFLNACRVGAGKKQLNQYGGFAGAFLRAQYSGFVGPLWAVNDVIARNITMEFYERAASGEPLSEILRSIREKFKATDTDPIPPATYIAYVYYGHPDMTIEGLNYTGGVG